MKYVLIDLQLLSVTFLIVRRHRLFTITNAHTIHVKYPLFLSDVSETLNFFQQIFETYSNIKFHENPSSGSRVVQCGRTDGQAGRLTKLIVAYRNFAHPLTKRKICDQ